MPGRHQSEQVADISPECPAEIVGIRRREALLDPRAEPYATMAPTGMMDVHPSLMEALATVPLSYGARPPFERIFDLAAKIRQRMEHEHPPEEADE
jgi:hypothetical protein